MPTSTGTRRPRGRIKVPVALPSETQSRAWLRSIRLSGFSILVLGILVLFLVVLAPGLRTLLEQRQQIADLEASVQAQKEHVQDLKQQRARWDDPAYIRAQARDRLFYVMPGEYPYLIIDDAPISTDASPTPVTADLETTQVDWGQSLMSSYLSAALTESPPPAEAPAASETPAATDTQ
jgi:cell division protein FtsB